MALNLKDERCWRHIFLFLLIITTPSTYALTPSQVFETVKDSIVVIHTYDANGKAIAQGSGVLISSKRIATNCHVIEDAISIKVGRDEQFVPATVYAGDSVKDVCLLDSKNIIGKVAIVGSTAQLKIGEPVYAIGAPKGMELSLSDGIISQLRGDNPPVIQTTAAISPGSSGGGLFDSKARLIGLTTSTKIDSQSINFAMPVEYLTMLTPKKKITSSKDVTQATWNAQAVFLAETNAWNELVIWGKRWIEAEPKSYAALMLISGAYYQLGEYEQALLFAHKALVIHPSDALVWYFLGINYSRLERYKDAVDAFLVALESNNPSENIRSSLALSYVNMKEYDKAIDICYKSLELNPKDTSCWDLIGIIYKIEKRYNLAEILYLKALEIDPKNDKHWSNLGDIYGALGRYDLAANAYRKALINNPQNNHAEKQLGHLTVILYK